MQAKSCRYFTIRLFLVFLVLLLVHGTCTEAGPDHSSYDPTRGAAIKGPSCCGIRSCC
ncbi:hypothetical protein BS78_09G050700 [Paspalum vaginatum]|nr:hypothetical protein BS78_09G050700 [Paspalum vaginatum]